MRRGGEAGKGGTRDMVARGSDPAELDEHAVDSGTQAIPAVFSPSRMARARIEHVRKIFGGFCLFPRVAGEVFRQLNHFVRYFTCFPACNWTFGQKIA